MKKLFFSFLVLLFIFSSVVRADITTGLVAHYKFDGDINDSVLPVNTLTGTASYDTGKFGQASNFNGGYLQTTENMNVTAFTVSFWMKTSTLPSSLDGLVSMPGTTEFFQVGLKNDGSIQFEVYDNSSNANVTASGTNVANDTWHHIVATYSDENGSKLYINGEEMGSNSTNVTLNVTNKITLGHLRDFYSGGNYVGLMDDVRIYSRELTSSEAVELYNSTIPSSGDDTITAPFSDATIDGLDGNDTVVLDGDPANYTIRLETNGSYIITNTQNSYVYTLINIEKLSFTNGGWMPIDQSVVVPFPMLNHTSNGGTYNEFTFTVDSDQYVSFGLVTNGQNIISNLYNTDGNTLMATFGASKIVFLSAGTYRLNLGNDDGSTPLTSYSVTIKGFTTITTTSATTIGTADNETITPSSSFTTQSIDGGSGIDIVLINGNQSDYNVTLNENGSYLVTNGTETYTLTNIEFLKFNDIGDATPIEQIVNISFPLLNHQVAGFEENGYNLFTFILPTSQNVALFVNSSGQDTNGELFNSTDLTTPINNPTGDDDANANLDFKILKSLPAGTYTLKVSQIMGGALNPYFVTLANNDNGTYGKELLSNLGLVIKNKESNVDDYNATIGTPMSDYFTLENGFLIRNTIDIVSSTIQKYTYPQNTLISSIEATIESGTLLTNPHIDFANPINLTSLNTNASGVYTFTNSASGGYWYYYLSGSFYQKDLVLNQSAVNELLLTLNNIPTDINLTVTSMNENQPIGTTIGTLSTVDLDTVNTHTYSFCGGVNDSSFSLSGNSLKSNALFDFETKSSYAICIKTKDDMNATFTKNFTINILNINEAPTLIQPDDINLSENFGQINVTLNGSDVDGNALSYSASSSDISKVKVSASQNFLTLYSVANATGTAKITATVTDGNLSVSKTFTINLVSSSVGDTPILLANNTWIDNKLDTQYFNNSVLSSTEGVSFFVSQKASALSSAQIYTPTLSQIIESSAKLIIAQTGTNASASLEMVDTNPNYSNIISVKSKIEVFEKQIVASIYSVDVTGASHLIHSENIFDYDVNKSFVATPLNLNIWIENGLNFSVTNTNHNQIGRVVTYDFASTGYTPTDFEESYISGTIDATQTEATSSFAMILQDVLLNQTLQKQFMKDFSFINSDISALDYTNGTAVTVTPQTLFDIKTIENSATKYLDLQTKQFVMGTATNYFATTVTNQNNIVQTITKEKEVFTKNGAIFVTSTGEKKFLQELVQSELNSLFANHDINITFSTAAVGYKVYEKVGTTYKMYYLFNNTAALDLINSFEFSKNATKSKTISTLWTYLSIPVNKPLCIDLYKTSLSDICNQNYSIESVFANVDGVFKYNNFWSYWDKNGASYGFDKIGSIRANEGLLVKSSNVTTLNLPYDILVTHSPNILELYQSGWFLINVPYVMSPSEIEALVTAQNKTLLHIFKFNGSGWEIYAPLDDNNFASSVTRITSLSSDDIVWVEVE